MKGTLLALFVGFLMVGCGESSTPVDPVDPVDSPKAIDLDIDFDDPATRDRIGTEAIDEEKVQRRGKEGEALYYVRNQQTPYTGWMRGIDKKGQTTALVEMKDGKFEGLGFEGLVGGQNGGGAICKEKFTYKNGKLHGPLMGRHENGHKFYEENWKDGKRNGLATMWYENGQMETEGNWKDDNEDGPWTSWWENGQKSGESNWKDGKLITAESWKPNGEKCPVTNVVNGNGVWVWYNEDGTESSRETYKGGE